MVRPKLKIGDIVKLSKKGKTFGREFPSFSSLVVSKINGDGIDRSSLITCRVKIKDEFKYFTFYRSELWATGKNAFNSKSEIIKKLAEEKGIKVLPLKLYKLNPVDLIGLIKV